jgi:glycosyltransferase involved in cell wall biosynthesis
LESLLGQTFSNWEAICVNDGSADNSLAVLEQYAARDPRIKVINQKNCGTCAARNNAIKIARGKYIFPLDADDKIAPTALAEMYSVIVSGEYALVGIGGEFFGMDSGCLNLPWPTKYNMYSWRNGIHNSAMYPRALWEKYGGYFDGLNRLGTEDFDFYLNFVDDGQKITRIGKPLFYYRIKPAELSRNAQASKMQDAEKFRKIRTVLWERHPEMRMYHKLNILKKIALLIPRFLFCVKTMPQKGSRYRVRYIRVLRIPVWKWKVK